MTTGLHLVRMPIDVARLYAFARNAKASAFHPDEGYALHALFAALFDHGAAPDARVAPKPFFPGDAKRRELDVLGYSRASHEELRARAEQFADPASWGICGLDRMTSRPMPAAFPQGTTVGFCVRACPVRRVKKRGPMERDAAEVDAFLAKSWADPGAPLDRDTVYREWLNGEFARSEAVTVEEIRVTRYQRGRFLRRTQGGQRFAHQTDRPDVTFEGVLRVSDSAAFSRLLARGLGRHRAFGFGMLLLRPVSPQ